MAKEWSPSRLVEALTSAGAKGMTKSALEKKIPHAVRSRSGSILSELRSAGSIQGPFKKKSDYYFAPQFAPTREQSEALLEKLLLDAGLSLTTKSELRAKARGFLQIFFNDAVAALRSEARIIELKRRTSTFYVHREAVLEPLRVPDQPEVVAPVQAEVGPSPHPALTLEHLRPIYEELKSEQSGIGTVKIFDILTRLGVAKEDLHRLLLDEAKNGRVSLHRASTTRFSPEVIEAGIRLAGQPEPLVTVVLKDEL
jgi:hypothetical protein